MNQTQEKKYVVIAKCSLEEKDFKKWRCTDLLSFEKFLDREYPNWKFFNVYDKISRQWLAIYKQNDRPTGKKVQT